MRFKQMLSRKVFRGFLSSFLIAFVLPLCLLVVLGLRMFAGMAQDQSTKSRLALEQYRAGTDGQLYALMRSGDNMMVNEKVLYFSTIGDPLEYTVSTACFTMLRSLMQDVSTLSMSNEDIESAYLYFFNSDSVVGSSFMSADVYYRRMIQGKFNTYEQWKSFLGMRANGFVLRQGGAEGGSISYMRTSRREDVTLVLDLKASALHSPAEDMLPEGTLRAIYDKEHRLLYSDSERFPDIAPDALRENNNGEDDITLGGGRAHVLWRTSASTGCLYANAIPAATYYAYLTRMKTLSAILLIALFLSGAYLCYVMAKKRYKPIDELRNQLAPEGEATAPRDDFAYLQDMLRGMQDEKATIRQRLKASNQSMEHYVIEQLMRGTYTTVKSIEEQLLSLDIVFESNLFAVIGIRIDSLLAPDTPTGDPVGLEESRQLTRFVVHNIFEELFASFSPLVLEMSNRIYMLITPDQGEDWTAQVEELTQNGREVLAQHYDMTLSVAISERAEGMHAIPALYAWCREALTQAQAGGDSREWLDIGDKSTGDRLNQSVETAAHKLEQLISTGDEAAVARELDAIKSICKGNSSWSVRMALTGLIGAVIKPFSGRIPQKDNKLLDDKLRAFLETAPSPDDAERASDIIASLARTVALTGQNERMSDLAARATRYIERHHVESSLNVSMVADQLGLTPSYASALFKKQTGQSMLDVINLTRIRHAKALLSQGRFSMEDIAEQVGYYNASTFIRVFKKYEGLTPGQYRATCEAGARVGG